jgi:outer membrane protein TolC
MITRTTIVILGVFLLPCFIASGVFAETVTPSESAILTLKAAINQALVGNPGLGEIKARANALATLPEQAGALPDPNVNVGLLNVPTQNFNLQQEDMTMLELGVSQTFPFPGKRSLREKIAEHEAMASAESVEEAQLRLVQAVKQRWWQLFYQDRALNVLTEAGTFFQTLIDAAQVRYKVGKGTQSDVILAQLELSKLKSEQLDLLAIKASEAAQFNALLDQAIDKPLRLPGDAAVALPSLELSALQDKSLHSRPLFAQHEKMLAAAKAKVELAEKDFYPDFTVSGGYAFRQNTMMGQTRSDFASVQLSMNVPLYANHKQAKAVDQRQSEFLQEKYSALDEHHKIQAEIAVNLAEYQQNKAKLTLLEHEIIPQTQQAVDVLFASYQVNQVGFAELLRAQLSFFQYQTQYWQTLTTSQQILAKLSAEVGEELSHD